KFWPGPETCGGSQPLSQGAGGLFKDLANTRVIRCDEAPWRFLGLSFAGWNVIASILLAVGAAYAAVKARGRPGPGCGREKRWAAQRPCLYSASAASAGGEEQHWPSDRVEGRYALYQHLVCARCGGGRTQCDCCAGRGFGQAHPRRGQEAGAQEKG